MICITWFLNSSLNDMYPQNKTLATHLKILGTPMKEKDVRSDLLCQFVSTHVAKLTSAVEEGPDLERGCYFYCTSLEKKPGLVIYQALGVPYRVML